MRDKIKSAALTLFDEKGFYNTGIRDVAALAGCSLPVIYYYFGSKEALFDTIVCEEFENLDKQISDQIPEGLPLCDVYYFQVLQRRMQTDENKKIYRLALKTIMGIEGSSLARTRLRKWDEERKKHEEAIIKKETDDIVFIRLLLRVVESMMQGAILFEDRLTNDDIRAELELLFSRKSAN